MYVDPENVAISLLACCDFAKHTSTIPLFDSIDRDQAQGEQSAWFNLPLDILVNLGAVSRQHARVVSRKSCVDWASLLHFPPLGICRFCCSTVGHSLLFPAKLRKGHCVSRPIHLQEQRKPKVSLHSHHILAAAQPAKFKGLFTVGLYSGFDFLLYFIIDYFKFLILHSDHPDFV